MSYICQATVRWLTHANMQQNWSNLTEVVEWGL